MAPKHPYFIDLSVKNPGIVISMFDEDMNIAFKLFGILHFVGDKYKLAKKIKKIKIVNHLWLEDWYSSALFMHVSLHVLSYCYFL